MFHLGVGSLDRQHVWPVFVPRDKQTSTLESNLSHTATEFSDLIGPKVPNHFLEAQTVILAARQSTGLY